MIWRWSPYPKQKGFFDPPEASNSPMTKLFELGGLQIILSEPPMSNSSEVTHIGHTSNPKFWVLQEMGKKVSYFLKQKIPVIQAKSFWVQKIFKKVDFSNIEHLMCQTLFSKQMTSLSLFHSQERFAIAHSYFEKIKFLKQKITLFWWKAHFL